MKLPIQNRNLAWLAVAVLAAGFAWWFDAAAIARVEAVSARITPEPEIDPASPTGYVDGKRHLIPADHNTLSYQWIVQTQQMLADGTWRLREVGYDNAPRTRPVESPSLYRWWLAFVAKLTGDGDRPAPLAVERAGLVADPIIHLLLGLSIVGVIGWRFGLFPAAMATAALAIMYPVVSAFYPGSPNDRSLAAATTAWSVLAVVLAATGKRPRAAMILAGLAGGLAIWVDPNRGVPVVAGLGLGGIAAAWVNTRQAARHPDAGPDRQPLPWRWWSLAGAVVVVVAYLVENAPDRLDWKSFKLAEVHPLYAIAWIGLGLVTARLQALLKGGSRPARSKTVIELTLGTLAIAAVPLAMHLTEQRGFLLGDAMSAQVSPVPGSERGSDTIDWLVREGVRLSFWATVLPLGFLGMGIVLVVRRTIPASQTAAVLVATVPILIGIGISIYQVAWWSTTGVLTAVLIAFLAGTRATPRLQTAFAVALALVLLPSLARLAPQLLPSAREKLTAMETRSLAERDLAYWLTKRVDEYRSVVLAPPEIVPALHYFGSVRGLGSPFRENEEGFGAAVRIAGTTSADEGEALATQRELSHIILPSWDTFMQDYARIGSHQVNQTLIAALHNWLPHRWLRAVHHPLPDIPGFAGQYTTIFEVVDVQDNATALSRLGEYFIESGQIDYAAAIGETLEQSFPSDLGGLVARAQIAVAQGDREAFVRSIDSILPYLEDQRDGDLLWDRRVNLANVLMLANQTDYAREQVQYCMDEVDEYLLRTATPPSLFRFIILCQTLDEPFPTEELEAAAIRQLPPEMQARL